MLPTQTKLSKILQELVRRIQLDNYKKELALRSRPQEAHESPWDYIPQKPTDPQKIFLGLTCKEALYGGSAGGGKSSALLMNALQWVHIPGYSGLIIRKSYTDLTMPGGLIDRAQDWLRDTKAEWVAGKMCFNFPSGARLFFGHLGDDGSLDKYQGAHFHFVGFDELTQHPEKRYTYLLSRNRRLATESERLPEIMRATSNPGGIGHDWVKKRFVEPYVTGGITAKHHTYDDCVFVPAKLEDNPHLDQKAYRASMERMDDVTKRQLLHGDWEAAPTDIMYPLDSSCIVSGELYQEEMTTVIGIDLGAREDRPTTAFTVMGYKDTIPNIVWVLYSRKFAAMTPTSIAEHLKTLMATYRCNHVVMDEGALGAGYSRDITTRYGIPIKDAKKRDKLGHRKLMIGAMQNNYLIVQENSCDDLITEWATVRWDEKGLDNRPGQENHSSDSALYTWYYCYSFLSQKPEPKPGRGTEAWYQEIEKRDIERIKRQHEFEEEEQGLF